MDECPTNDGEGSRPTSGDGGQNAADDEGVDDVVETIHVAAAIHGWNAIDVDVTDGVDVAVHDLEGGDRHDTLPISRQPQGDATVRTDSSPLAYCQLQM